MVNDTVYKFDDRCQPLPYYGNTIVSYLNEENQDISRAAVEVQKEIKKLSFADHLAFLPPSSFHMTVLTLSREIDRNTQYWSPKVPSDARFSEVDRILKNIVDKVPTPVNVWMEVEECEINRIILKPSDAESARRLSEYRDLVAEATGVKHVWHDGFRYHLSLDYLVKSLNESQEKEKEKACREFTERLRKTIKPFLLTKPDFVIFNDMMSYEKDLKLRGDKY